MMFADVEIESGRGKGVLNEAYNKLICSGWNNNGCIAGLLHQLFVASWGLKYLGVSPLLVLRYAPPVLFIYCPFRPVIKQLSGFLLFS